jgi:hypothetical protein
LWPPKFIVRPRLVHTKRPVHLRSMLRLSLKNGEFDSDCCFQDICNIGFAKNFQKSKSYIDPWIRCLTYILVSYILVTR